MESTYLIEKIEILFLILAVAKFTALLIFLLSREEGRLAQWMKKKRKCSEIFIVHVLYLSWTDSAQMNHAQISVRGVVLQLLAQKKEHTCNSQVMNYPQSFAAMVPISDRSVGVKDVREKEEYQSTNLAAV